MKHPNRQGKERRKKDAVERNNVWSTLTPIQQLSSLDARLGKGVGASKQRARIASLMQKGN